MNDTLHDMKKRQKKRGHFWTVPLFLHINAINRLLNSRESKRGRGGIALPNLPGLEKRSGGLSLP